MLDISKMVYHIHMALLRINVERHTKECGKKERKYKVESGSDYKIMVDNTKFS